jgi:hypothetical protein
MQLGTDSRTDPGADAAEVPPATDRDQVRLDEALVDREQPRSTAPSWSQLAAGVAVLVGIALLLLRTDVAGQIWGAVLAALGLVATVAVEWVKVAHRRALQH